MRQVLRCRMWPSVSRQADAVSGSAAAAARLAGGLGLDIGDAAAAGGIGLRATATARGGFGRSRGARRGTASHAGFPPHPLDPSRRFLVAPEPVHAPTPLPVARPTPQ